MLSHYACPDGKKVPEDKLILLLFYFGFVCYYGIKLYTSKAAMPEFVGATVN